MALLRLRTALRGRPAGGRGPEGAADPGSGVRALLCGRSGGREAQGPRELAVGGRRARGGPLRAEGAAVKQPRARHVLRLHDCGHLLRVRLDARARVPPEEARLDLPDLAGAGGPQRQGRGGGR